MTPIVPAAETVRAMYESGMSTEQVSDKVGFSANAVRRWIRKAGGTLRSARSYNQADREEQIWRLILKGEPDECWPWAGYVHPVTGYGVTTVRGVRRRVHRYVLLRHLGLDDSPLHVLHSCDNRICCNPAHLRLGTNQDNMDDKMARGRCRTKFKARSQNPLAKLSEDDVRAIKADLTSGAKMAPLARRYGVSLPTIYKIKNGIVWNHV